MSAEFATSTCGDLNDDPRPHLSASSAGKSSYRLDADIATVVEVLGRLGDRVAAAPTGMLGVSSTGFDGDIDANLEALMAAKLRIDALMTIAATRADEQGETWQGFKALLRSVGKTSPREVWDAKHAGTVACTYGALGDMWLEGLISASQIRSIGRLAAKLPSEHREAAVRVLADHAPTLTERELAHAARVLLNAVLPGWEEREAEAEERRSSLSIYPEESGYGISGHLTVEQAGWVRTVLDAQTSVIASDDRRTFNERQAEAFVTVFRTYANSDLVPSLAMARPTFIVLTTASDLSAMARDAAPADLPMTTFGDRLDPATTKRLLSDADVVPVVEDRTSSEMLVDVALDAATAERVKVTATLLTKRRRSREYFANRGVPPVFLRLLTTPVRPLALGRSVRTVPAWLRNVVTLRDQHCVVDGCDVPAHRCEVHHVRPWALGGNTDLENLAMLCVRHHRSVESGTWHLRPRTTTDAAGRYWLATAGV